MGNGNPAPKNVEGSRSPAVSALAGAQLEYYKKVRKILEQELPRYLSSEGGAKSEDEAASLYAEYAIDFAVRQKAGDSRIMAFPPRPS